MKLNGLFLAVASFGLLISCAARGPKLNHYTAGDGFWLRMDQLCGQAFSGRFKDGGQAARELFSATKLVLHVVPCEGDSIQLAIYRDDNLSQTWTLHRSKTGLAIETRDHLNGGNEAPASGQSDTAADSGSAFSQNFPTDTATAARFPELAQAAWHLDIRSGYHIGLTFRSPKAQDRFELDFDLTQPITPPNPHKRL